MVNSTLYALRTSPAAREVLGDEIYFAHKIPWINGVMNQLHGRIDISFWVQGTQGKAKMRFRSVRPDRMGYVRIITPLALFFAVIFRGMIFETLLIITSRSLKPKIGVSSWKMAG